MKRFLIIFIIIGLCKPVTQAQCPPGASGFEVANPSCTGGCAVLLTGWPTGVIVNIFSASPLDSIGTSGVIPSSGSAFVCIPCHSDLIFASYVPGATNGCVILVGTLLSVTLNSFTVAEASSGTILKWDVSSETGSVVYTVQRSVDGKVFNDIGIVNGDANGEVLKSYSYSDEDAAQGLVYYRLKITDGSGSLKYSSIVSINSHAGPGIKIFPNPITGNSFTLNIPTGFLPALVTISDTQGRTVYFNQTTQISSTINTSLSSGIYSLKVIGNNNTSSIQKIIKK